MTSISNDSSQVTSPSTSWTKTLVVVLGALAAIGLAVMLAATALSPTSADAQGAVAGVGNGEINWNGWTASYDNPPENGDLYYDGLALTKVSYDRVRILDRVSFPVMNVYYQPDEFGGTCGPYSDRLGNALGQTLSDPTWREFTVDGVQWLEIGVHAQIGAYAIYQAYYLSDRGEMDVHIFSKGLQCNAFHEHLPFLRLDFDISTFHNDQILRRTPQGTVVEQYEFDLSASAAVDHEWTVRDSETFDAVSIDFDDGGFAPPEGVVVPETNYVNNGVYGRLYKPNELDWGVLNPLAASRTVPWNEGEYIDGQDSVIWYTSYMPHSPVEGPDLWHSTGLRLTVHKGTTTVPTPIPAPVTPVPLPTGDTCGGRAVTVDLSRGELPTEGDDVILGTANNDQIAGLGGNDIICGGGGDDSIWGQAGDDTIYGQAGNDRLRGGSGADSIFGGFGADDINGGRDDDWIYGEGDGDPILRGGTGDDVLHGGDGNDALVAGNGGEDFVSGAGGNDKVTGGPRPDNLNGGEGNDELRGGGGADRLFGENGDDSLFGGKQPDTTDGGAGTDTCNGGITGDGAAESDVAVACESLIQIP